MLDSLIETKDGQRIAARFFRPQGEPKGSVLIVPAMGVTQGYYQPFASWLARQGFNAATFDYRGTGLSRPSDLRGFKADIFDWARLDCAAMIDALPRPLYWIGHSLGGQRVLARELAPDPADGLVAVVRRDAARACAVGLLPGQIAAQGGRPPERRDGAVAALPRSRPRSGARTCCRS
jgi:predicted alpha/beta hydrolase